MVKIIFKDVESSIFTRILTEERLENISKKFPQLENHTLTVTLSMENSPLQPGPDIYSVHLRVSGPKFRRVFLKKKSRSFYLAIADLSESLLEVLSRAGERSRVAQRTKARREREKLKFDLSSSALLDSGEAA